MKPVTRFVTIAAVALLLPALASAQRMPRMPREGGWSLWGGLGVSNPTGEIDADVGFSGGVDYFVTRSFSVGALAGAWKADAGFGDDAKEAYVDFVAAYNWEGGRVHPFVQGGVGPYFVNFPFSDKSTNLGGFVGGGLDIFFARAAAVDLAFRYHIVPDADVLFPGAERDAKFFEAHGGVKVYF